MAAPPPAPSMAHLNLDTRLEGLRTVNSSHLNRKPNFPGQTFLLHMRPAGGSASPAAASPVGGGKEEKKEKDPWELPPTGLEMECRACYKAGRMLSKTGIVRGVHEVAA